VLFLERARFIHIGAPDCRVDDLTISALDDQGRPVDTVIWLRNGGGKTVLLGLFFAHLLPGARDFLRGKKENARFSDHVLDGDTSYVAARWVGAPVQLSLSGGDGRPRLVTGRAVERRPGFSGTVLPDLFFSFRPLAGVLDLDSLPWAAEDRRHDLGGFHAELERLSRAHPELDLVTTDKDAVWASHLRRQGLDPEIVRYQLQMNAGEGEAATGFMKFRTSDEFVDFVVGVVTPREALDTIEDEIRTYAAKLRRLPEYRCELELIERALPALRAHADNLSSRERLEEQRRTLLARAAALRAQLDQAHAIAVADATEADEQRSRLDGDANEVRQDRNRLKALVQEAAYLVAEHRFDTAREELRAASERCGDLKRQAEDWALAEPIAQQRSLLARQAELQEQLAERKRDAEPRRLAAERAGSALRLRLLELASAAAQEADALRRRVGVEDERSRAAWREAERAAVDLERHRNEVAEATSLLHTLEAERSRLRANDSLAADETAEAAVERWQAEAEAVAIRLTTIGERLPAIQRQRDGLQDRRRELAAERERLDGERRRAEERIEELSRDRDALWSDAVLMAVCEVAQPDLWVERGRLEPALERRAQELSAELIATELSAAADRRSRAALESSGHLPPALDVERALDVLRAAGIATAYPGWEYLRRMRTEMAAGVLISAPELAGGILLNDPDEVGPALSVLEASGVQPTSVVALGLAEELMTGAARTVRLWRPHPALFDRAAGEVERARLAERLSAVDGELAEVRLGLEAVREFRARLFAFFDRWPAGTWVATRERVTGLVHQIGAADARAENLATDDRILAEEAGGLEAERTRLLERGQRVPGIVAELRALAASEALEAGWRAVVADGPSRMRETASRRTDRIRESDQARGEAELARDEAAKKRAIAEQWETQAGGLPSGAEAEPGLAELSAETLRQVWEQRDRSYRQELGAESIAASLDAIRERLGELDVLTRLPEAQLERVRELLAYPDGATEEMRRAAVLRAEEAHRRALAAEGERKAELRQREDERDAAKRSRLPLEAPLVASSLEAARGLEDRYREEDREAERRENSLNSQRGQARERAGRARVRAEGLRGATDTLTAVADLAHVPDVQPYAGDVHDAREAVASIVDGLKQTGSDADRSRTAAAGTGRRLQQLAEAREYQRLGPRLTTRVADPGPLASHATALAAELELRLAPLRADIDTAEADRRMVVGGLVKAVKDAFRDLRRIGEASRLPEGLDAWGGEPFVRIQFEQPRAEDEWELRVGGVVEDWVNREQVPMRSGLAILRQALRRANTRRPAAGESASVFLVTLLKPDAILTTQRYAVEAMKFSEGQDLTTAILLYCAFVNQRVLRQGDPGGVAGALLLDNPIGKASLEQLIRLQRTVATVMGVQLIATTGVRDREAISHYPKVIGIRPVRSRDGRRKYLVANDDPIGDGMAAAELIARASS
jgi:hypothetical protein